ncbi:hypothetical protein A3Q34_08480 [Colwellia sp. PAMC 20917]|uniref:AAA family ATPase n=1 Tax=Colwellia sp. PAMC 20917 TaxID=1816218 RepID=UPI00087875D5|nr:AAA family ATPase [Colwellia sp. PAMC 20917]AOW76886.1 hypothetical protein A3Q34_08480 [Colwellia sp. PAMC 20917]
MKQLAFDFDTTTKENNMINVNNNASDISNKTKISTCINEILNKKIIPPCVIIPNFLVGGESTMLCSLAGDAKTFFSQYSAACIATGSKFLGTTIDEAQSVLYIDSELSEYQIQQRFKLIYNSLGVSPKEGFLKIIHKRSFKGGMPDLSSKAGFEKLKPEIENSKVIILDNISSLYRSAEETVQNDWNFYNDCLDELRALDKAVLVLHHTDKRADNKTVISIVNTKNRHCANDGNMLKFEFGAIGIQEKFEFRKII